MDLAEIQRRLLNAIAGPESAGRYNVRYTPSGGTTFSGYEQHPRIYEIVPKSGKKSSAAGRYQIVYDTYRRMGGGSFHPADQDKMALQLAEQRYKRVTGRDIYSDIQQSGMTPSILGALKGEWEAFTTPAGVAKGMRWYNAPLDGAQAMMTPTASTGAKPTPASTAPPTAAGAIGAGVDNLFRGAFAPIVNTVAGREVITPPPAPTAEQLAAAKAANTQTPAQAGYGVMAGLAAMAQQAAAQQPRPANLQPVYNKNVAKNTTGVNLPAIFGSSPSKKELEEMMGLLGGGSGGHLA